MGNDKRGIVIYGIENALVQTGINGYSRKVPAFQFINDKKELMFVVKEYYDNDDKFLRAEIQDKDAKILS